MTNPRQFGLHRPCMSPSPAENGPDSPDAGRNPPQLGTSTKSEDHGERSSRREQRDLQRSDIELLRAAGGGDDAAFHELVERHTDSLFRVAVSLTATRADAEDLLQETFLGAYRGLGGFNGKAAVKTWLNSILIRQAAKGWRRGKNHRQTRSIQHADQDQPLEDASLSRVRRIGRRRPPHGSDGRAENARPGTSGRHRPA